ncbi:MAG: flagellar biosynthetic protein FliO [Rhodospirillales bacterium]|jgi:flagellar protein FliO/FliZ
MEIDSISYIKFLSALLFVLGLIGGLALLAKKFGMGNLGPTRRVNGNRLSIIESMQLDAKRRVVLVRRDDKDHMLLLGGATELIIESNISVNAEQEKEEQLRPERHSLLEFFRQSKKSSQQ